MSLAPFAITMPACAGPLPVLSSVPGGDGLRLLLQASMPVADTSGPGFGASAAAAIILLSLAAAAALAFGFWTKRRCSREIRNMKSLLSAMEDSLSKSIEKSKKEFEMKRIREEEIMINCQFLESQKKELEEYNRILNDSVNYAALIQQALLPTQQQMAELFSDFFVVFKPLRTVSGDFYWSRMLGKARVLAIADCTGHGVPGAFMSVLGICILTSIVSMRGSLSAGDILDQMRDSVKSMLHQDGKLGSNEDGMEMALIILDGLTLHYAGANRPLMVMSGGEIKIIHPDNMPVGVYVKEKEHFRDNVVRLKPNDILYAYSDGVTDQFGFDESGERKKFSTKRLVYTLQELSCLPMACQKSRLEDIMKKWIGGTEQLDDQILVGVKV